MVTKHAKATKLFAAVLAVLMVLAMSPATAFAATKKTVKSYDINFSDSATYMQKKKATVVRKGTTNLTYKGKSGLIMFTAPKAGKYTFTFTNCKNKTASDNNCYISVYKKSTYGNYITGYDVKTKGGKYSTLWLSVNNHSFTHSNVLYRPIKTRVAKSVKLKKGEKIYFYKGGGYKKMTCKLTIK